MFLRGIALLTLLLLIPNSRANEQQLVTRLTKIQGQHGVAAVSVLLVRADEVLLNVHLGVRNWDHPKPFQTGDLYRIGSISKTFAGLLAMRLSNVGLVDLDRPLRAKDLNQALKNQYPQPVTLRQLLEHSAGLTDLSKAEWDHNQPLSLSDAFGLKLASHQTRWPPGYHKSYSNLGAGLFGLVLEQQLNDSYENLMEKHVLQPLGMSHTNLILDDAVQSRLIKGYDRDGHTPIPYWHVIYRPAAAINTNNQDMIRFLQLFLGHSATPFLSPAQLITMRQPQTTLGARSGLRHGYGLGLSHWQHQGHDFWGHGGDADGYLSRFGFNPESGVAYSVMITAFNHQALNPMVTEIENHIIQALSKPKYPRRLAQSQTKLSGWLGQYEQVTQRFGPRRQGAVLSLRWIDGQLHYERPGRAVVPLYRVDNLLFRTRRDSVATMALVAVEDELFFQTPFGNFKRVGPSPQR